MVLKNKKVKRHIIIFYALVFTIAFLSCKSVKDSNTDLIRKYESDDPELYEIIVAMDKEYFDAYNTCDLKKQASIYSKDIEFFHDKGGLMTSKQDIIDSIEKNICGKVTRELVEGSIEVYPIADYGAVEIGFHKFFNKQEPEAISTPSKFITIWKGEGKSWKITKVISLH